MQAGFPLSAPQVHPEQLGPAETRGYRGRRAQVDFPLLVTLGQQAQLLPEPPEAAGRRALQGRRGNPSLAAQAQPAQRLRGQPEHAAARAPRVNQDNQLLAPQEARGQRDKTVYLLLAQAAPLALPGNPAKAIATKLHRLQTSTSRSVKKVSPYKLGCRGQLSSPSLLLISRPGQR